MVTSKYHADVDAEEDENAADHVTCWLLPHCLPKAGMWPPPELWRGSIVTGFSVHACVDHLMILTSFDLDLIQMMLENQQEVANKTGS